MHSKSMAGWLGFAAIVLLIVGVIDFFQGLIAVFEDEYFVPTGSGFLVLDLTGWGWAMMIWGVLLVFAGLGLAAAQGWARWFAIVVVSLNFIAQLGFLGNTQNTLWSLTGIALSIIVLYALTARWSESEAELNTVSSAAIASQKSLHKHSRIAATRLTHGLRNALRSARGVAALSGHEASSGDTAELRCFAVVTNEFHALKYRDRGGRPSQVSDQPA